MVENLKLHELILKLKIFFFTEAYGSGKRQLEILSRSYRKQYGCNFVTLLPTNILGKKEVLRTDGPVVESLIAKALNAKRSQTPFVCRGSGSPIRQFCYAPGRVKYFNSLFS